MSIRRSVTEVSLGDGDHPPANLTRGTSSSSESGRVCVSELDCFALLYVYPPRVCVVYSGSVFRISGTHAVPVSCVV